ncbi:MAG: M23 family metallopeptidase [Thermaurantiacus sp.]|uniref:M23 family metallopeptidase n=1 Tax=Thermaurantiacus sp. TaxID=2820283 RepID=UPI00298F2095|nr:M23 family metallopeptidase [Thermaurantiacus sp.]MDW8414949.1 M23 family metallopeptidase [Thermaurantiacus sp.]
MATQVEAIRPAPWVVFRWHPTARPAPSWDEPVDLLVDLGDDIGSARWWRGLLTLGALAATAIALGLVRVPAPRIPPVPEPADLALERRATGVGALASGSRTGRPVPPGPSVVRLSEIPERPRLELVARLGSAGLAAALRRAGVGPEDVAAVLRLVEGAVSSPRLEPDTELDLVLGRRETRRVPRPLERLAFRAALDLRLEVVRTPQGLALNRIPIAVDDTPLRLQGPVGRSLAASLRRAGVPAAVAADFLRQLGYVLDIQRDVRARDRFDLVVEHRRAETGEREFGRLLYAGLEGHRRRVALLRFGPKGEFFGENGEGARRGLIRTPVEGARLSSGFGMRFHPILGFSRLHQGVDFAAPTGTPVVASAAGRVTLAGWSGGYGQVVEVDHGRGLKTRYAHLSRIDVRPGQAVGQGQRIGAVGSTGLSTGPHLHYEVWRDGRAVNPAETRFLAGPRLEGAELARFKAELDRIRRLPATSIG